MNSLLKATHSVAISVIVGLSLVIPAFFLTITTDFYDFNKFALLFLGVMVLMIISLIHLYTKHEVNISSSSLTIPAVLFALATLLTVIINSPNKIESLVTPQGAGGIILITLWFMLVMATVRTKEAHWIVNALIVSASFLGLLSFLQIMGIGVNAFVGPQSLFDSKYWTPAGSLLSLILLLVAVAPIVIVQFERALREYMRRDTENVMRRLLFYGISAGVIVVAVIVILSQLLFTSRPVILPFSAGWTITLESLKNVQRALFGVGPGNYIFAYTTGRPDFINLSPLWNIRFLSAPNWYMQVITELGLVGLAAYIMLIVGLVKKILSYVKGLRVKAYRYDPLFLGITLSLFIIIVEQIILPGNFLQLFTFYTLLALASVYLVSNTYVERSKILSYILTGFGAVFVVFTSYVMYRAYSAEFFMKKSVDYSTQNKARETYAYQSSALRANPYIDRYHVIFSQTNLALATALSQKKDLTDNEKLQVIQLLTQTTNEGKNAIFANPTNVQNWENLARIYKTMVNQVKDADRWSLQAYQQSIALDPLNPLLRLEAGGVLYSVGRFDLAAQAFQETVGLKRDWPNAYYNLGLAYKEQKNYQAAAVAIQRALETLPKDSKDREKAQKELDEVKKNITQTAPANTNQQGGELTNPPAPAPSASPGLELPNAASPDNAIDRTQNEAEKLSAPSSPPPTGR